MSTRDTTQKIPLHKEFILPCLARRRIDNERGEHIMAIESGTYKKAHRHGSGAQVIVLRGKGYSLMWPPDGDFVRVNWRKGSLLVPPEGWYHHHFTTSREAARHLALRRGF